MMAHLLAGSGAFNLTLAGLVIFLAAIFAFGFLYGSEFEKRRTLRQAMTSSREGGR